jgi:hypothetical protein
VAVVVVVVVVVVVASTAAAAAVAAAAAGSGSEPRPPLHGSRLPCGLARQRALPVYLRPRNDSSTCLAVLSEPTALQCRTESCLRERRQGVHVPRVRAVAARALQQLRWLPLSGQCRMATTSFSQLAPRHRSRLRLCAALWQAVARRSRRRPLPPQHRRHRLLSRMQMPPYHDPSACLWLCTSRSGRRCCCGSCPSTRSRCTHRAQRSPTGVRTRGP